MNSAAAIAAPVTAADRFGIGPGRHRRHAVDMSIAAKAESGTPEGRHPVIFGVCGERVTLARKWGAYGDQNGMLAERRCEQCSWIVALHQGTTEREIVRYSPDELQRNLIANSGHDPDLLTTLLRAVLANHRDELNYERPEPGVVSELLAHLCRHRPVVIVCGECWDSSPQVHGTDISVCSDATVACMACTFLAGAWAGEFEDSVGAPECFVHSPCSVLTSVAAHFQITTTTAYQEANPHDS